MDIQHLIYALEVKNCGSISKAAQKLFMAQPNLSNAIKELEQEINTVIFKRTSRGIETTMEGLEFLHHAGSIVSQFKSLNDAYVKETPSQVKSSISVTRSSAICGRFVAYINYLCSLDSSLRIHFRETTNDEVIRDVIAGRSVLGIFRSSEESFEHFSYLAKSSQCEVVPISSGPYAVVMAQDHPLANEEYISKEMLRPYTEIIQGDFEAPWYSCSDAYEQDPIEPGRLIFVYDRGSVMDCVRNIRGAYTWTFVSRQELPQLEGYVVKPCEGQPNMGQEALIYKKSTLLTSKIITLVHHLGNVDLHPQQ